MRKPPRKAFGLETCQEIRAKYESGMSAAEISREYNCRVESIYYALRRAGGRTRSRSEARILYESKQGDDRGAYIPSPEDIAQEAAKIKAKHIQDLKDTAPRTFVSPSVRLPKIVKLHTDTLHRLG